FASVDRRGRMVGRPNVPVFDLRGDIGKLLPGHWSVERFTLVIPMRMEGGIDKAPVLIGGKEQSLPAQLAIKGVGQGLIARVQDDDGLVTNRIVSRDIALLALRPPIEG